MKKGKVLNMRTATGTKIKNAIKIDRGTKWGNPYKIGFNGDRAEVIKQYKENLYYNISVGEVDLVDLAALHGRDLLCWCAPDACHGDVLIEVAEWASNALKELDGLTKEQHDRALAWSIPGFSPE